MAAAGRSQSERLRMVQQEGRTPMRCLWALGLASAIALAGPLVPAPPASAADELSADTVLTTASGATFTAPMGWRVTSSGSMILLDPPETDSHLALVDVPAADADAALAAGWAAFRA